MLKNIIKKTAMVVTMMMVLVGMTSIPTYADNVNIVVNGRQVQTDTSPIIRNGRTLVPIRVISENMGYTVAYNSLKGNEAVLLFKYNSEGQYLEKTLLLPIGENKIYEIRNTGSISYYDTYMKTGKLLGRLEDIKHIAENPMYMDTSATIYNSRTMIPLRAVSEALGKEVNWDNNTRTVTVNDKLTSEKSNVAKTKAEYELEMLIYREQLRQYNEQVKVYNEWMENHGQEGNKIVLDNPTNYDETIALRNNEEVETQRVVNTVSGKYAPNTIKYKNRTWTFTETKRSDCDNINSAAYNHQRLLDQGKVVLDGEFYAGTAGYKEISAHASDAGFGIFNSAKIGDTFIITDKNGVSMKYQIEEHETILKNNDGYSAAPKTSKYMQNGTLADVISIQTCYVPNNNQIHSWIARPINF